MKLYLLHLTLQADKDLHDEEKETEVSTSGSVTINAKDKSKGNGLIIVLTSVGGAAILGAALYFYLLKNEKANRRKCVKLRRQMFRHLPFSMSRNSIKGFQMQIK